MKHIVLIILLSLFFQFNVKSQSYAAKKTMINYDQWEHSLSNSSKISLVYYVLRLDILTYRDYNQKQKTVSELPKYRYELYLTSESIYNRKTTKTMLTKARVYINNAEVTYEQFPNGFSVIIETTPTLIYWYETSKDSVNLQIKWENSNLEK